MQEIAYESNYLLQVPQSIYSHFKGPIKHHGSGCEVYGSVCREKTSANFCSDVLIRSFRSLDAVNQTNRNIGSARRVNTDSLRVQGEIGFKILEAVFLKKSRRFQLCREGSRALV